MVLTEPPSLDRVANEEEKNRKNEQEVPRGGDDEEGRDNHR